MDYVILKWYDINGMWKDIDTWQCLIQLQFMIENYFRES